MYNHCNYQENERYPEAKDDHEIEKLVNWYLSKLTTAINVRLYCPQPLNPSHAPLYVATNYCHHPINPTSHTSDTKKRERLCTLCNLVLKAPAGSVDDESAHATGDDTGDRQGHDPTHVDPGHHAPIDGPPGAGAETNTDGGTSDALSGGDRELCINLLAHARPSL